MWGPWVITALTKALKLSPVKEAIHKCYTKWGFSVPHVWFCIFMLILSFGIIFCFASDPATKMWSFSLEDYRQLSMKSFLRHRLKWSGGSVSVSTGLLLHLPCLASALQWRKRLLSPPCLWGLWRGWAPWTSQRPPVEPATARLLGRCWSCATAGRNLELSCRASASWCLGRSLRSMSATMLTSLQRSSRCQQRTTVTQIFFGLLHNLLSYRICIPRLFGLRLLLVCPRQTWKPESGAFHWRITRDSVSNNTFSFFSWFLSALLFVSDMFAILSDRAVFHTQWISSVG